MHLLDVRYLKIQKTTNMLLPDNVHPENSIYYNASLALNVLQEYGSLDMLDLSQKISKMKKMSFPVFILCLD